MKPQLTLTFLISADGKTATRSGEALASIASPEYKERVAAYRTTAGCLLIDTALPPFEILGDTPVIILGSSAAWQPLVDEMDPELVATIETMEHFTTEKLESIAHAFGVSDIHCEPSSQLAGQLIELEAVDYLNLAVLYFLPGGHAADTLTGNGASPPFSQSQQFSLISNEQTENEIYLGYAFQSSKDVR